MNIVIDNITIISSSNFGTSSRNGNGIFCSNITGRNIVIDSGVEDKVFG